jgi:four helix bundle protein
VQDFRRLIVWQKARVLAKDVSIAVGTFPRGQSGELRSQCRRAASSIAANIAEGCGKSSSAEFIRYLDISAGSTRELENHLIAAIDLELIDRSVYERLIAQVIEVRKMLLGLIRAIRNQPPKEKRD